ncbi:hypothetical protein [Roseisolibacter sp. H3M3-2]|uniref:hypothetical protein n=1 Tax=Roseisolibacter sp. H3M3-2 TaxID=3031323 RepID=UPI0023DA76B4|nr:hypothetical protein [Roseisolibacter sp. H3M3-2]MDF1503932.1 hypothetical protein [Roseisolibacter sp. H3M3-2]
MTAPVTPPTDPLDFGETPAAPPPAPPIVRPPPPPPVAVPLGWLLDHASYAVRARALLEFAGFGESGIADAHRIALGHRPAVRLALAQRRDGTWPGGMLALPRTEDPAFAGVGTVPAVRRLVEYGWPVDAPPLWHARRPLFRLLAQDDDPRFLYELAGDGADAAAAAHGRHRLREAAASALAHLGLETDPRLRGAAIRILDRVAAWVRGDHATASPLPETAAPPSIDMLVMLAHMPIFRTERTEDLGRLATFLTQPAPAGAVKQRVGKTAVPNPRLVLGDPLADVTEPDGKSLPRVLAWLEILARLGLLRRHEPWRALLDHLLDLRDADGRWTRPLGTPPADPLTWPIAPLGPPDEKASWQADVTFRLALVARLAGRPPVLV